MRIKLTTLPPKSQNNAREKIHAMNQENSFVVSEILRLQIIKSSTLLFRDLQAKYTLHTGFVIIQFVFNAAAQYIETFNK